MLHNPYKITMLPESPDFDPLILPRPGGEPSPTEPCPRCSSLELWQDLQDTWHCQRCDSDKLGRSRGLAARAANFRQRAQPTRGNRAPDVPQDATGAADPTQNTLGTSGPR